MWDDMPKRKSTGVKILIFLLVLITLGVIGYSYYVLFGPGSKTETDTSTNLNDKIKGSPSVAPTIKSSPTLLATPSPVGTPDYKVPTNEVYLMHSSADTNGDSKEETLVITRMNTTKYHAYVLDAGGEIVYDNKLLDRPPVRIATQTYDSTQESYLSWMLVFIENSGELAFIHWNGTKYEIPQLNSGI